MVWLAKRLAWCALAGAMLATLGSAAWQSWKILDAGYALDAVAAPTMAFEVMQLHLAFGYGALAGVACGLAVRVWRLGRALARRLRHTAPVAGTDADADTVIRGERTQRADAYLATLPRRVLDGVTISADDAHAAPDVESVIAARDGRPGYRVLAYRALTPDECAQAVQEALRLGRVREPEPGGIATVLTSIGR